MNPFKKFWFWLLILSIIGFIITFILFETIIETSPFPSWIWIIFGISTSVALVAFILYIVNLNNYNERKEILTACGQNPKPVACITYPKTCPNTCQANINFNEINYEPIEEVPKRAIIEEEVEEEVEEIIPIRRGLLTDDRFSSQKLIPLDRLPLT